MAQSTEYPYETHLDVRYQPLEVIDLHALAGAVRHPWFNQTLTRVNDSVVRVGIVKGEYHWHKHDDEDEFFYVVDGRFVIELEGRRVELTPGQGFTIPRGVMHKTLAAERTIILMVEGAGVIPTGD